MFTPTDCAERGWVAVTDTNAGEICLTVSGRWFAAITLTVDEAG